MLAAVLPNFGYTPGQIAAIVNIILATRLPQAPQTLLEQIMADADLSVLGQANYLLRNAALRQELAALGQVKTDAQWYGAQLQFIRDHRYFRATASRLLDRQKHINVAAMTTLLEQSQSPDSKPCL